MYNQTFILDRFGLVQIYEEVEEIFEPQSYILTPIPWEEVAQEIVLHDSDQSNCGICLENCHTITDCGHPFHKDCLMNWLKIQWTSNDPLTCPICLKFFQT